MEFLVGHSKCSPDIVYEWLKEIPRYAHASTTFDLDSGVLL